MIKQLYLLFIITLFTTSCSFFQNEKEQDVVVARVHDKYLLLSDIQDNIPGKSSKEDSLLMVRSMANVWVEKQLLVKQAENNLTEERKNVERQVEEYRNDLLIYAYQSQLINQKLDTTITDEEIETYYNNNQQNFELKDYIVKVVYIKLDTNAPQLDNVKKWFNKGKEEDLQQLEDYAYQFASNFYFDENNWLYLEDLLKEVPLEEFNKSKLLKNQKTIDFNDGTFFYLVRILDYRLKNSISPLSFERNNIKNIIINQRKKELIDRLKKDLLEDARSKKKFELFDIE